MYAHSASNSHCAGFSIHVKAEVILWVGHTDDALLVVLGDSSTGLTCQSPVDKADKEVYYYCYDFSISFCFGISLAFIFVSRLNFEQYHLGVDFSNSTFLLRQLQIN
ncbi:hypothetical protein RND71_031633 [Anisodus tanguticus]|uniref:Uncharacterized protein n=1 Tax=Anisodus tanguticus TaxID=243964 RepID=A0AAE1UXN6_9SOLA|nr:hypothetical protein RND71_031633 [Anisodus tanguticus]